MKLQRFSQTALLPEAKNLLALCFLILTGVNILALILHLFVAYRINSVAAMKTTQVQLINGQTYYVADSFNGNNSSNEANNFSHSSNSFQAANAPNGAGSNGKKTFGERSVEPLSREEERELAGHDGEADELLTSEYRIKQDNEGAETHPVSEKPEVRTFSVLMGTGTSAGPN
ncbi:hypothetical protein [Kamptonema sp. PCC 6506]|uniref:hypothetical protein n=1 Tax=Kamptonema sp. PCC 6506 TaxID=272129 RepID=UPI0001DACF29|nr:hypothetical protein [Kamptonema sp. PCC 6506]CBN56421.1 hypothetical protein OSCI_3010025 [Kamptonema sp. PCC 6506]